MHGICAFWHKIYNSKTAKNIVKLVAKNTVLGSPGIHFMHMTVKAHSCDMHFCGPFNLQLINSGTYFWLNLAFSLPQRDAVVYLIGSNIRCNIYKIYDIKYNIVQWKQM